MFFLDAALLICKDYAFKLVWTLLPIARVGEAGKMNSEVISTWFIDMDCSL